MLNIECNVKPVKADHKNSAHILGLIGFFLFFNFYHSFDILMPFGCWLKPLKCICTWSQNGLNVIQHTESCENTSLVLPPQSIELTEMNNLHDTPPSDNNCIDHQ